MSRQILPRASGGVAHLAVCDRCGDWVIVTDPTDLPPDWAARVDRLRTPQRVLHYCPACDPGPAVRIGRYQPDGTRRPDRRAAAC